MMPISHSGSLLGAQGIAAFLGKRAVVQGKGQRMPAAWQRAVDDSGSRNACLSLQRAVPDKPRPLASHCSNFARIATWRVAHQSASVCSAFAMFSSAVGSSRLV